ncbi:hypothetical protein CBS101457_005454 [Exobasidium rhododendri]|nr:hypothetical protein CBS101457_005454 [Exobasidium rhododendri]
MAVRHGSLATVAFLALVSSVSAQNSTLSTSTSTVISSLVLNLIIFAVEITAFIILRPRFKKIYRPKTFLGLHEERVKALPDSMFGWVPLFIKTPTSEILYKNGLDAYQFVAFCEMMIWFFAPTFVFTWILLMPIYGAKPNTGASGFNQFVFGNVGNGKNEQLRLIAPLFANWIIVFWFIYVIRRFMAAFVKHRQDFLTDPKQAATAQARTILITGIPNDYLSVKKLTSMYSHMPGGVAQVWLNRDLLDMPDLFDQRLKACNKLEAAQSKLTKIAFKKIKKGKVEASPYEKDSELRLDVADKYVTKKERPAHKLGAMGCFGEKVDTINWCQDEIVRLTKELDEKRSVASTDYETYKPSSAAFIMFHTQAAAYIAAKSQAHHLPYRMANHFTGAHPLDIIWPNLNLNPYAVKIRSAISWTITIALVIFWTVVTGVVGIISNVNGLAQKYPFHWINSIPKVPLGIIEGILPTVLLAVLNILLVMFLRFISRLSGIPTRSGVELSTFTRMSIFQLVQNFLILTIISGASSNVSEIINILSQPAQLPALLANVIPKASVFFLSYVVLAGLTGAASGFLQIGPLIVYYIKKYLLASTPRKTWHIDNNMSSVAWATLFSSTTLITVIGIGYTVLAPIMNLFALVAFTLLFIMHKYNFTYVYNMSGATETAGLFFPKAINFCFAAIYLEEVVMTVLFFLAASAKPEGAFMIVLIVITVGLHFFLYDSYGALFNSLPLSLVPEHSADFDNTGNGHNRTPSDKKQLLGSHNDIHNSRDDGDMIELNTFNQDNTSRHNSNEHEGEEDPKEAFNPIPLKEGQRPIWLAEDPWGIGQAEYEKNRQAGIKTTTKEALVTDKGKIETSAHCPPGEILL